MKLLNELIEGLSGEHPSLTDGLMKTKVLLHKLGRKDLADWVNLELNGYPDDVAIPKYRILNAEVTGNVSNGVYTYNSQPLPTIHLDEELRSQLNRYEARESISALENLARARDKQSLAVSIAPEFNGLLGQNLTETYAVQRAWCSIAAGQLAQIMTQVRSRLLDFLLELSGKVEDDMSAEDVKRLGRSPETASMFNNAISGDNVTILVGDNNRQRVTNRIVKGDFESLKSLLKERNVGNPEIIELRSALKADADGEDVKAKRFGPRVRGWMKKMLSKAVDASWQIELGVAGDLLTDALKAYYGW